MAELPDNRNKTVLHIDIENSDGRYIFINVALVFQRNINVTDWKDEILAEMRWYKLAAERDEILDFLDKAKRWISLSLAELARTSFGGRWNLGANDYTESFELEFKPLAVSPEKTDGFTVIADISYGHYNDFFHTEEFHSDYTSLVKFVDDLSQSVSSLKI